MTKVFDTGFGWILIIYFELMLVFLKWILKFKGNRMIFIYFSIDVIPICKVNVPIFSGFKYLSWATLFERFVLLHVKDDR